MKIALTDVLRGGKAGPTVIHFTHPRSTMTLCYQYPKSRVASFDVTADVNCMTCLVRANGPSFEERIASAWQLPKEFLYDMDEDDGPDDR